MPLPTLGQLGAAMVIVLFLFIGLEWFPWLIHHRLVQAGSLGVHWLHWLQTVTGNWPGSQPEGVGAWEFAYSTSVAILLNNAMLFVVVGLIWRLAQIRRREMNWRQALVSRDQMHKAALFKRFPENEEMAKIINECFVEGDNLWQRNLKRVFGVEASRKIIDELEHEIS